MSSCEMHMPQPTVLHLFPVLISLRKALNKSHMFMTKHVKSFPTGWLRVSSGNTLDQIYVRPTASDLASLSLICAGVLEQGQMCLMESEVTPRRNLHFISCPTRMWCTQLCAMQNVHMKCSIHFVQMVVFYCYLFGKDLFGKWSIFQSNHRPLKQNPNKA